jgi:hypothetical protein
MQCSKQTKMIHTLSLHALQALCRCLLTREASANLLEVWETVAVRADGKKIPPVSKLSELVKVSGDAVAQCKRA